MVAVLVSTDLIARFAAETEKQPQNDAFFLFSRKQPWRASVYATLRLWKIRFDNKMITVEILILF